MKARPLAPPTATPDRPFGRRRGGMTLLEVVFATVVLAASMAVLAQLLNNGRVAAARSAAEVEAVIRAESTMAIAVASLAAGTDVGDATLEEDGWTVRTMSAAFGDLPLRRISVEASAVDDGGRLLSRVRLDRLVRLVEEPS